MKRLQDLLLYPWSQRDESCPVVPQLLRWTPVKKSHGVPGSWEEQDDVEKC